MIGLPGCLRLKVNHRRRGERFLGGGHHRLMFRLALDWWDRGSICETNPIARDEAAT
jgi:hypothetical protein